MFSAREVLKQGEEVGVVEEKASHRHLHQQQGDQDGDSPIARDKMRIKCCSYVFTLRN